MSKTRRRSKFGVLAHFSSLKALDQVLSWSLSHRAVAVNVVNCTNNSTQMMAFIFGMIAAIKTLQFCIQLEFIFKNFVGEMRIV